MAVFIPLSDITFENIFDYGFKNYSQFYLHRYLMEFGGCRVIGPFASSLDLGIPYRYFRAQSLMTIAPSNYGHFPRYSTYKINCANIYNAFQYGGMQGRAREFITRLGILNWVFSADTLYMRIPQLIVSTKGGGSLWHGVGGQFQISPGLLWTETEPIGEQTNYCSLYSEDEAEPMFRDVDSGFPGSQDVTLRLGRAARGPT